MMSDLFTQALSYIGNIITDFLMTIATPFIGLLPNVDNSVIIYIRNFFVTLSMPNTEFNFLYFINWPIVSPCINIFNLVLMSCIFYKFIRFCISIIHDLLDSIPVVG